MLQLPRTMLTSVVTELLCIDGKIVWEPSVALHCKLSLLGLADLQDFAAAVSNQVTDR